MREGMGEVNDEKLVQQFLETHELSYFDVLVRRHVGRVRVMIYPMVLNDADADDLTQEVFLRVVQRLSGFQGRASFATWLHRIALNTTYDFLRRKQRCPTVSQAELPEQPDQAAGPAAVVQQHEFDDTVSRALAALSLPLRGAIMLTAIEGLRVTEAARVAGCLVATMYWRVHQARKQMKAALGAELKP